MDGGTAAFPKILHIGDAQIKDLFEGPVEITEKVDGSQLGFGKVNGRLFVRSKGRELDLDNPDGMFQKAVDYVKQIESLLPDNTTFYGEYLSKPKHNTLAYDRVPKNNIALFGVYNYTTKEFGSYSQISKWAETLDVETVPLLAIGKATPDQVLDLVKEKVSFLGGQNIEGVVVKAYKPWLFLGQIPLTVMSGKYVTEAFKEVHHKNWKAEHTGKGQLEVAMGQYRSEARWNKAIQHLRDNGELEGTPRDIGSLIREVRRDVEEEEKESIKDLLWKIYGDKFLHEAGNGLPQWYKEKILVGDMQNVQEQSNEGQEDNPSKGVEVSEPTPEPQDQVRPVSLEV